MQSLVIDHLLGIRKYDVYPLADMHFKEVVVLYDAANYLVAAQIQFKELDLFISLDWRGVDGIFHVFFHVVNQLKKQLGNA